MTAQGVVQDEIAKRYGGVLFDLAQKSKSTSQILKEVDLLLKNINDLGTNWDMVIQPTVKRATQLEIAEKLKKSLKLSTLLGHFLDIMCQNRRLAFLKSILENYKKRFEASEGEIEGVIEASTELTTKQMNDLIKALKEKTGKHVILNQSVREELLAGVVMRLGSIMVDASLRTKLAKLRQEVK